MDKVHKSLFQICKCIHSYIREDFIDINDPEADNNKVKIILSFLETITNLSINKDQEISKFFIEESTQYGKFRGT